MLRRFAGLFGLKHIAQSIDLLSLASLQESPGKGGQRLCKQPILPKGNFEGAPRVAQPARSALLQSILSDSDED